MQGGDALTAGSDLPSAMTVPCLRALLALFPAAWLFHQEVAVAAAQQGQELQLTIASQPQQSQQEQQEEREQQAQALWDAVISEEMMGLVGVVEAGWDLGGHVQMQGYWVNAVVQLLGVMEDHAKELLPEVGGWGGRWESWLVGRQMELRRMEGQGGMESDQSFEVQQFCQGGWGGRWVSWLGRGGRGGLGSRGAWD